MSTFPIERSCHVSPPNQRCFDFLFHKVRILVVDDEPEICEVYEEILSLCPLYRVDSAASIPEAKALIRKNVYHVCLLDLGLDDLDHDELYLLRKYGRAMKFIIISARKCMETGYLIGCLGGTVFEKPVKLMAPDIPREINEGFLRFLATPVATAVEEDAYIGRARQALAEKVPENISDWAESVGIGERYLRRKWRDWIGCKLRHSLYLYQVFFAALAHSCAEQYGGPEPNLCGRLKLKRWCDYYGRNEEELDAILDRRIQPRPDPQKKSPKSSWCYDVVRSGKTARPFGT
ncbi:MAG: response regulator [Chitinivibrionales bacterium]|nr:response regulator [Chitinivibrionales bacterium]